MQKGRQSSQQGRIDSFFSSCKVISSEPTSLKRKVVEKTKSKAKNGNVAKRFKK